MLIANKPAIQANSRYVQEDLNRCFTHKALSDTTRNSIEATIAREINQTLGPKGSTTPHTDLIIDLHNTTAATGICLLFHPDDTLCMQIAAFLHTLDESVKVCTWTKNLDDYAVLASIAPHGMTFEVGPAPWGCLEPSLYARSLKLIHASLEYVDKYNNGLQQGAVPKQVVKMETYSAVGKRDYPRDEGNDITAMIHPKLQGQDYRPLKRGDPIFMRHDLSTICLGADDDEGDNLQRVMNEEGVCYPFFINEAAYYEQARAFSVAQRKLQAVAIFE